MKHSIKPYSKDLSEVQWAFYKSTKDYLILAWCIKEKWKLNAKDTPRLHISHERNESKNIPILVEERGDAFQGIPKLRRLSLLEYLLGVPWESPSFDACNSWIFLGVQGNTQSWDFFHTSYHHIILLSLHLKTSFIQNSHNFH